MEASGHRPQTERDGVQAGEDPCTELSPRSSRMALHVGRRQEAVVAENGTKTESDFHVEENHSRREGVLALQLVPLGKVTRARAPASGAISSRNQSRAEYNTDCYNNDTSRGTAV